MTVKDPPSSADRIEVNDCVEDLALGRGLVSAQVRVHVALGPSSRTPRHHQHRPAGGLNCAAVLGLKFWGS